MCFSLSPASRVLNERRYIGVRPVRLRLSHLDFNYTPLPGFDTRNVKGLVASLLALKPEDHGKSNTLEINAGGKLYNFAQRANVWAGTSSSMAASRSV
jgi:hypothetical protein